MILRRMYQVKSAQSNQKNYTFHVNIHISFKQSEKLNLHKIILLFFFAYYFHITTCKTNTDTRRNKHYILFQLQFLLDHHLMSLVYSFTSLLNLLKSEVQLKVA